MQANLFKSGKKAVAVSAALAFLGVFFLANPVSFAAAERTIPYPPGYVIDKEGA